MGFLVMSHQDILAVTVESVFPTSSTSNQATKPDDLRHCALSIANNYNKTTFSLKKPKSPSVSRKS